MRQRDGKGLFDGGASYLSTPAPSLLQLPNRPAGDFTQKHSFQSHVRSSVQDLITNLANLAQHALKKHRRISKEERLAKKKKKILCLEIGTVNLSSLSAQVGFLAKSCTMCS